LLPSPVELRAFRAGYKAALITVALAFGLSAQFIRIGEAKQVEE